MNRRKTVARGFSGAVLLLLLAGCPYESQVPMGRSEDAQVDRLLVGKWQSAKGKPGETGTIVIVPFNEHELLVVIQEEGAPEDNYCRAYTSAVDGEKFLNVQEIKLPDEKEPWLFVNYAVSNDELRIRLVEEDLFKGRQNPSESPLAFIRANLKNKALYDQETQVFRRVTYAPAPGQPAAAKQGSP